MVYLQWVCEMVDIEIKGVDEIISLLDIEINNQNTKAMITNQLRDSTYQNQHANLYLNLKEKKHELITEEEELQKKIKQYFSELTLQIYQKENEVLESFKNKIYDMFESIDGFCSMSEYERNNNESEIEKILKFKFEFVENTKLKEMLNGNVVDVCCKSQSDFAVSIGFSEEKTNKKGSGLALKAHYNDEIVQLEERIEKLMLKEEKLKGKLYEMESKHKMKKLGNAYLPYEEKSVSNLLLQRLESENKVLIEQIADCSQKMLSMQLENSVLMKEKENSHVFETEKKKCSLSVHNVEESVEYSQYQERISSLEFEIDHMKEEIFKYKDLLRVKEVENSQVQLINEQKIQEVNDYNERLYRECDSHISKKAEIQEKLQEMSLRYEKKCSEYENIKEMNMNYVKVIRMKEEKIEEICEEIKNRKEMYEEIDSKYKKLFVESAQCAENKQMVINEKLNELESVKLAFKKQQIQQNEINEQLAIKEEELFNQLEKCKAIQADLTKALKEKESHAKKEVTKVKKELKKEFEEEKKVLDEQFNKKYGEMLERIEMLRRETIDYKEKMERKSKIEENRMLLLKERVSFEMKEMMDKMVKQNQKDKLIDVIQSYIENESTICLKNTQIKMLKEENTGLKKGIKKEGNIKSANETEVNIEIQKFEKKLFEEKLETQILYYESRLKEQQESYENIIQDKVTSLESLLIKVQNYERLSKDLKNELQIANSSENVEMEQLKKTSTAWMEKERKLESHVSSLKNSLSKSQTDAQQAKDELKLKKDIIVGLKKELKEKEVEKSKLNETINALMDDADKLKRTSKEANKKEAIFEEFREKLVSQTELSEEICQLKMSLEEKQKMYKTELHKKDQIIKDLKINEEIQNKKLKSSNLLEEEILDLKQKIRKFKLEIERKDTLVDHLKDKNEKANNENVLTAENNESEIKKLRKDLELEKSKFEAIRFKHRKLETNLQLLKLVLIKIYEKLCSKRSTCVQKEFNTYKTEASKTRLEFTIEKTPDLGDMKKYKEGLSILEISGEDLDLGNGRSIDMYSPVQKKIPIFDSIDVGKLTELLEASELDNAPILKLFEGILED